MNLVKGKLFEKKTSNAQNSINYNIYIRFKNVHMPTKLKLIPFKLEININVLNQDNRVDRGQSSEV